MNGVCWGAKGDWRVTDVGHLRGFLHVLRGCTDERQQLYSWEAEAQGT